MNGDRGHASLNGWRDMPAARKAAWFALGLLLLVVVAIVATPPLTAAIARAEADVARDTLLLQSARKRIADGEALAGSIPPARTGDVRAAVEAEFARHGLRAAPTATPAVDGQFGVVVGDASFDTLVRALDALARSDAANVVEARFTALVQRGQVRAELTFGR